MPAHERWGLAYEIEASTLRVDMLDGARHAKTHPNGDDEVDMREDVVREGELLFLSWPFSLTERLLDIIVYSEAYTRFNNYHRRRTSTRRAYHIR